MQDPQADDAVDDDAAEEVEGETGIETPGLVLERRGEVRVENQEVDRVAGQDRHGVFDPSSGGHAGRRHAAIVSSSGHPGNRIRIQPIAEAAGDLALKRERDLPVEEAVLVVD